MKNSKQCIKCKSQNILGVSGIKNFWKRTDHNDNCLWFGKFEHIPKDIYVCGDCGYTEEWVRNEDLDKIRSRIGSSEDLAIKR